MPSRLVLRKCDACARYASGVFGALLRPRCPGWYLASLSITRPPRGHIPWHGARVRMVPRGAHIATRPARIWPIVVRGRCAIAARFGNLDCAETTLIDPSVRCGRFLNRIGPRVASLKMGNSRRASYVQTAAPGRRELSAASALPPSEIMPAQCGPPPHPTTLPPPTPKRAHTPPAPPAQPLGIEETS